MIRIEHGDMLEVIPRLVAEEIVVDAIVTDPPYGLEFMGKEWDTIRDARPWARQAFSILKPGGGFLSFGGSRTHHRLWCAIEDAGFVIQDTIMWLYGSGFPKGHWQLKPAWEPICVAYKPGGKRTLQVEECRINTSTHEPNARTNKQGSVPPGYSGGFKTDPMEWNGKVGRWPANVCHDGSDEVMEVFAAFGEKPSCGFYRHGKSAAKSDGIFWSKTQGTIYPGDTGTAARFFYCAKADAEDRWGSKHPTVKPVELMKWLVPLVTPKGGLVLDPFAGSGTTAVAALGTGRNAILIEKEADYISDIRERLAFYEGHGRHSMVVKNRNRREAQGTLL